MQRGQGFWPPCRSWLRSLRRFEIPLYGVSPPRPPLCRPAPPDPATNALRWISTGAVRSATSIGVAEAAAAELERYLVSQHPVIVAMGTGRMLRAMVEQLTPMDCPQHKVVSLVGNIAPDGSASLYDVVSRILARVPRVLI